MATTQEHVLKGISNAIDFLGTNGVGKDGKNTSQGFNFRSIDTVHSVLNMALRQAHIAILPTVLNVDRWEVTTGKGAIMTCAIVDVEYRIVSLVDGSFYVVRFRGEARDSGDKTVSKALSMAYKYMAIQTFCIPVEGQDDADLTTVEPAMAKTAPKAEQAAEAPVAEKTAPAPKKSKGKKSEGDSNAALDAAIAAMGAAATLEDLQGLRAAMADLASHPEFARLKAAYKARAVALLPSAS
jgi:hypothetical protein